LWGVGIHTWVPGAQRRIPAPPRRDLSTARAPTGFSCRRISPVSELPTTPTGACRRAYRRLAWTIVTRVMVRGTAVHPQDAVIRNGRVVGMTDDEELTSTLVHGCPWGPALRGVRTVVGQFGVGGAVEDLHGEILVGH